MQAVIYLKHISINFFKVAKHKCLISNFENCFRVGSISYFLTGFVLWSTVISIKLILIKAKSLGQFLSKDQTQKHVFSTP